TMDVPHGQVRLLDVSPKAIGIEQRSGWTIKRQFAPEASQQGWRRRQLERTLLVSCKGRHDELRHVHGAEQASRDAGRERLARARKHRQSGPQRVARSGVRVVGKRIEEKVRRALACEMLRRRYSLGKYDP